MSDLPNNALQVMNRLAKTTLVVLMRVDGKLTLALDPGLNTPWRGQGIFGRKMGEEIVKDCTANGVKAEVRTWGEALDLLLKEAGGPDSLERALYDRMVKKHQDNANLHKRN